ncbi:MAG: hypothetical protein ABMB14_32660, partial [Myxococcota bacterium]
PGAAPPGDDALPIRLGIGAVTGTAVSVGGELSLGLAVGPGAVELRGGVHHLRPASRAIPGLADTDRTVGEVQLAATAWTPVAVGVAVRAQFRPTPRLGLGPTARLVLADRRARVVLRLDGFAEPFPEERALTAGDVAVRAQSPVLYAVGGLELGWRVRLD